MLRRISATAATIILVCIVFISNTSAATLGPSLQSKLAGLAANAKVGTVIVAFNTSNGLNDSHLNVLRTLGITSGIRLNRLGMVAFAPSGSTTGSTISTRKRARLRASSA